jgi:4-hydroxybenzoate polyprenyltransferase
VHDNHPPKDGPPEAGDAGHLPGWPLLQALRPEQWVKNLVVLAALLFGQKLTDVGAVTRSLAALAIFCALSGCVYLLNDLRDMERDRLHPAKRQRPLASGRLRPAVAWVAAPVLALAAMAASLTLPPAFSWCAAGYLVLNMAYSFGLKNVVILDILAVAGGFVLRAVAGAVVIPVEFSNWLVLCTLFLALFMVAGKRRHELTLLQAEAGGHRASLEEYSIGFLDQMITVVLSATVVAYSLYALSPEVANRLHTQAMPWTVPFVLYGIFRYLYLIHHRGEGGNPTRILFTDRPLMIAVVLWVLAVAVILNIS